jgi:hypothetical protein
MASIIGILAIGLMVLVLIIAVGSLIIVGSLPFARLWQRLRSRAPESD